MTEPAPDLHGLLRTFVEQQTALLGVHAESVRLQRILVERVLGFAAPLPLSAAAAAPAGAPSPRLESESGAAAAASAETPIPDEPPLDVAGPAPIVAGVAEPRQSEDRPTVSAADERPAPPLRVAGGAPMRSDRYYQLSKPLQRTPAQSISLEGLHVLRCIQAAGDVAHLVLTFGPHAGEPLGQVAQSDPDYLRNLAQTAQRPDVRAAAARLVDALPSSPPPHGRRTSPRSRHGAWRGAS
jgi:hypothetical protein